MNQQRGVTAGWGHPANSRKWHYFSADGRSLCCRWLFMGYLENEYDDHAENCAECKRRLAKMRAQQAKATP